MSFIKSPRHSFTEITLLMFLICTGIYFLLNIHYYYVPDPDVFEYLTEGGKLLHTPWLWIPTPPFYSVVLHILDTVLPITNAGIVGGTLINIIFFLGSVYILWKLTESWLGSYALLPLLCFIVSPLSFLTSLQPMNAGAAVFFVLLTLYLQKNHPVLSYICMALAFFCRLEAIILLPIVLIWEGAEHKKIRIPIAFTIASSFVLLWTIRGLFEDKLYSPEIFAKIHQLPNVEYFSNTFFSTIFNVPSPIPLYASAIVSIWILYGLIVYYRKKMLVPSIFGLYLIGYTAIHLAFPAVIPRYSYGSLPFILALLYWPVTIKPARAFFKIARILFIMFLTIIIVYRAMEYRQYQTDTQWNRADKRVAGIWLQKNISKPTIVYGFLNVMMEYYAKHTYIVYPDRLNQAALIQNVCNDTKDVLVYIGNDDNKNSFYYYYGYGKDYADTFKESDIFPYFQLLQTFSVQGIEREIYIYRSGSLKQNAGLQAVCISHHDK